MGIRMCCPKCKREFSGIGEEFVGKLVRCNCGNEFRVPQPELDGPDPLGAPFVDLPQVDETSQQPLGSLSQPGAQLQSVRKRVKKKRRPDDKGDYRLIDVCYIVVGALAFVRGMYSVVLTFFGILSLASSSVNSGVSAGVYSDLMPSQFEFLMMNITGVLVGITHSALGACGLGVVIFIHQRRTIGKSNLSWSLIGGAICGGANIILSLVNFALVVSIMSGTLLGRLVPGHQMHWLVIGMIIPLGMVILYFMRGNLKFRDL